jgi:hypothetical protein
VSQAHASQQRDDTEMSREKPVRNLRQKARITMEEISPYDKVPDKLISFVLSLQSKDA